jgi:phage terminase small subunit
MSEQGMRPLSEKERRFVDAYMGDAAGNATRAAELAGYSVKSARRIGTRLSSKAHIKSEIGQFRDKAAQKTGVTVERVIGELARIGFSDMRDLVDETGRLKPLHELSEDAARALAGVEVSRERVRVKSTDLEEVTTEEATVKVKLWDKPAALVTLARYLGILKDKVDHKHTFSLEDVLDASRAADGR